MKNALIYIDAIATITASIALALLPGEWGTVATVAAIVLFAPTMALSPFMESVPVLPNATPPKRIGQLLVAAFVGSVGTYGFATLAIGYWAFDTTLIRTLLFAAPIGVAVGALTTTFAWYVSVTAAGGPPESAAQP